MSEDQDSAATAEATAEQDADTTESQEATGSEKQEESQTQEHSFDLTVPDGFEISDQGKTDFAKWINELGIPKDKHQAILDKHLTELSSSMGGSREQIDAMHQGWAKESMNDKEFGGSNLNENIAGARKTMNSFSQPATDAEGKAVLHQEGTMKGQQMTEIELLLNQTGMGNHPAMIRVFHRVKQVLSEDHFVRGDMKPNELKKTDAEVMYPTLNK
jgi:hypothetical protein